VASKAVTPPKRAPSPETAEGEPRDAKRSKTEAAAPPDSLIQVIKKRVTSVDGGNESDTESEAPSDASENGRHNQPEEVNMDTDEHKKDDGKATENKTDEEEEVQTFNEDIVCPHGKFETGLLLPAPCACTDANNLSGEINVAKFRGLVLNSDSLEDSEMRGCYDFDSFRLEQN